MLRKILAFSCLSLFLIACDSLSVAKGKLFFTLLSSSHTGIDFNNQITENDSVNVFDNEYMYNGSGVGIVDFNNDGLVDVFMGGSMVSSKLYLNKGNMQFEDITEKAGVQTTQWITGISVVDINSDGFQDIYLCSSHAHDSSKRRNLLFINDGKLHFTEQAEAYGLADTGFSTQAAFLDYDRDGDLDMYLLNHRLYDNTANNLAPKDTSGLSPAQDKLYRNDGITAGHPVFSDVTSQAGIKEDGYGLGIVVSDVNNDGWPDVFAGNDYIANDLLWLNKGNGTFTNRIASSMRHQSYNSMGTDAADINNDGLQDIASLDMTPEDNERKKMMFTVFSQEKYEMQLRMGYEPAFMRNMLQLNNGTRKVGERMEPFFSEIGQMAGISETDWSWSVLFADFNNDGWKDVHITNGLAKDVTNNDFTTFKNEKASGGYSFGGTSKPDRQTINLLRTSLDEHGSVKVDNYYYHNNGNLTFSDHTGATGLANPSVSNGAAYADLDNDGDLDLVVNNMNQEAFIYRNELRGDIKDKVNNFLAVQLDGTGGNKNGYGAKLTLFSEKGIQYLEQNPVRGFVSSVDQRLHFGLGTAAKVDSLKVEWPDGKVQTITRPGVNSLLTLRYAHASVPPAVRPAPLQTLFDAAVQNTGIDFLHKEMLFYDYGAQRGLLQKYSQLGPCLAKGDVNGDGLEDLFVGGAAMQPGKLFLQQAGGSFNAQNLEPAKQEEDLGTIFFDADGDKDLDLLVSGGSMEFPDQSASNAVRLYTNDGKGHFTRAGGALPQGLSVISKALAAADYDGDGDEDLFIGGYVIPQHYPQAPRSYLLRNDKGVFTDVTSQVCPQLLTPGLVTAAIWADVNNDRTPDLVITGEWMPVRFFQNKAGKLSESTGATGLHTGNGMWRSLAAADMDGDGDVDLVAGNMGANNRFHISEKQPMKLFAKDIDKNGTTDIIPAYYLKDRSGAYALFPAADRNLLADRFPSVKKKYLLHKDFATVQMAQLLEDYGKEGWQELACDNMHSIWIENRGGGKFGMHTLPVAAQLAPVNTIIAQDINGDKYVDLLLAGNEYEADAMIGRYDASYGVVLKGRSKGSFSVMTTTQSGLVLEGDVKDMKLVRTAANRYLLVAAANNDRLQVFGSAGSK